MGALPRRRVLAGSGGSGTGGGERLVVVLAIHDLHGLVDGVKDGFGGYVGGMDAIKSIVSEYTGRDGDLLVYLVGDMLADWRHRRVNQSSALNAWKAILKDTDPAGTTFGNHELVEFEAVLRHWHKSVHCHNLDIKPWDTRCDLGKKNGRHPNAVCTLSTTRPYRNSHGFVFSGVVQSKDLHRPPKGMCVHCASESAKICPEHWRRSLPPESYVGVLLAHYDDSDYSSFVPPHDDYKVILKAHDHKASPSRRGSGTPIIVAAMPNGRSVGVLELVLKGHHVTSYRFFHRVRTATGTPWSTSTKHHLAAKRYRPLLELPAIEEFGGSMDPAKPHMRRRAVCLGLEGMSNLFARADDKDYPDHHLLAMSPTAIRDDAIVPGDGGLKDAIDPWDVRSMYGTADVFTDQLGVTQVENALTIVLQNPRIKRTTYDAPGDPDRQLIALYEGDYYQLSLDGGEIRAKRLMGPLLAPQSTSLPLDRVMGKTSIVYLTLPRFERKPLLGISAWKGVESAKRVDLLRSGIAGTPVLPNLGAEFRKDIGSSGYVADAVARLLIELQADSGRLETLRGRIGL